MRRREHTTFAPPRAEGWPVQAERVGPGREAHWGEHLGMALSLAACLGLAVFVFIAAVGLHAGGPFGAILGLALTWGGIVFALALPVVIVGNAVSWKSLLWQVETVISRDIDGDRQVGRPEPLRAIIVRGGERQAVPMLLEGDQEAISDPQLEQLERFGEFCRRVLALGTIARSEAMRWRIMPPGVHGSPKISRTEWESWRTWFATAGLLDDQGQLRGGLLWSDVVSAFPDLALGGREPGREGDTSRFPGIPATVGEEEL